MQDTYSRDIDNFVKQILPMTLLRRNPGGAFKKLEKVGGFIITKDGRPVGKLLPLHDKAPPQSKKDKLKKLQSLVGGFNIGINLNPRQINKLVKQSYEEMLSG